MQPESAIPQYGLKDANGKPVDFDMLLWDIRKQDYNYEKPHRHNFHQVLIFFQGGGTHDIDFTTYKSKKYSVHFVASDNVHLVLRSKGSSGCSLLFTNDYFDKDFVARLPFNKTHPVLQLKAGPFKLLEQSLNGIKKEYTERRDGYENIIRSYMQLLMLQLTREYNLLYPDEENKNTRPELINRFLELVAKHYTQHYNVEQYAGELHISAKHLIEKCKEHTGKTPLQHIREYVIAEAKKLLYHTGLSIKEVSFRLNFNDPANFSKYFKAATSYTPAEYREGIR